MKGGVLVIFLLGTTATKCKNPVAAQEFESYHSSGATTKVKKAGDYMMAW